MIQENAPVFSAAGQGLAAFYTIDFSVDLTHEIPCAGTWQGDEKIARTLYVDNYNNNFALSITTRTGTFKCPAYSQGNIALSRDDRITVASEAYGVVPMTLYTEAKSPGFTARGNPPAAITDQYLNQLISLYVFGDNRSTEVGIDSVKTGSFGLLTAVPWVNGGITYKNAQFSPQIAMSRNSGATPLRPVGPLVQSLNSASLGKNCTIEFTIYVSSMPAAGKRINLINIGGMTVDLISSATINGMRTYTLDGSLGANTLGGAFSNLVSYTEYKIAVCIVEGTYVFTFVNGKAASFVPNGAAAIPMALPTPASQLQLGVTLTQEPTEWFIYLKDIRITNAVRYAQPYDPNIAFYNPSPD